MTSKEPPSSTSSLNARGSSSTILAYDRAPSSATSGCVRNACSPWERNNCSRHGKDDVLAGSDNGGLPSCREGKSGAWLASSRRNESKKTRFSRRSNEHLRKWQHGIGTMAASLSPASPSKRRFVPNKDSPTWKSIQKKQKESPNGNANDNNASDDDNLAAGQQLSANSGAGKYRTKGNLSLDSAISQMPSEIDLDGNAVPQNQQQRQIKQRDKQEQRQKDQHTPQPLIVESGPREVSQDGVSITLGREVVKITQCLCSDSSTLNVALERLPEEKDDEGKGEEDERAGDGKRGGKEEEEENASTNYPEANNSLVRDEQDSDRNNIPKIAVGSSLEFFDEMRNHQQEKNHGATSANTVVSAASNKSGAGSSISLACPSSDSTSSSLIYSLGDTVKSSSPNNGSEIFISKPSDDPIKGSSMMYPQDDGLEGRGGNDPLKLECTKSIDDKSKVEDEDYYCEDEDKAANLVASTLAECRMLLEMSPPPTPVTNRYHKATNFDQRHNSQSQDVPPAMQLQLLPVESQPQAYAPHTGNNSSSITKFLTCPACSNEFSDGPSCFVTRVPLHSFACDHIVCSACVFASEESNYRQAVESTPTACPECGAPGAFDTNRPVVSRGYLGLMRKLATESAKSETVPNQICVPSPVSVKGPQSSAICAAKDLREGNISDIFDSNVQAYASFKDESDNEQRSDDQGDQGNSNHSNEQRAKEKTASRVEPTTPVSRAEYRFLRRKEKLAHSLEKINRIIERSKAAKGEVGGIHLCKKTLDEEEIADGDTVSGMSFGELNDAHGMFIEDKNNERRGGEGENTPKKELKGGYEADAMEEEEDDTSSRKISPDKHSDKKTNERRRYEGGNTPKKEGDQADAMEEDEDDTSSRKTSSDMHSRRKFGLRVETGGAEMSQGTSSPKAGESESVKKPPPLIATSLPMAASVEATLTVGGQMMGQHDAFPMPSGDSDIFRVRDYDLPLIDVIAQSVSNDCSLLSGTGEDTLLLLAENCTKGITSTMDSSPLRKIKDLTINIKGLTSERQQRMVPGNVSRQEPQHQNSTCPQFLPSLNYSTMHESENEFVGLLDEKSQRSPMWSNAGGSSTFTSGCAKGIFMSNNTALMSTTSNKKRMGRARRRSAGDRRNYNGDIHPKFLKQLLTPSFDETFCRMNSGNNNSVSHIELLDSPRHWQSNLEHLQEEDSGLKKEKHKQNTPIIMQRDCQGPSYEFSIHSCSMSSYSCDDDKLHFGHAGGVGASLGGALVTHKSRGRRLHKKILNLRRNMWKITSKS